MEPRPVSPGVGPSRPRQRVPSGTRIPAASVERGRARQRTVAFDPYAQAMLQGQVDQFLTEPNGLVLAPRLPAAYRQALMPAPQGQARPDVAYFDLETVPERMGTLRRLGALLRSVFARVLGYTPLPESPPETP